MNLYIKLTLLFLLNFNLVFCLKRENYTIRIFGDSHSWFCFTNLRGSISDEISQFIFKDRLFSFVINWFATSTMHKIGRDGFNFLSIKNFEVKEGDVCLFVFGEIDVRCHIGKQRDKFNRDLDEIIDTLVKKYLKTILENKKDYNNLECIVVDVVPPLDSSKPSLPIYGTLQDRIDITKKLNQKLKEEAIKNNLKFFSIYDEVCTESGSFNEKLSDGNVHVNPKLNDVLKIKLINLINKIHCSINS